MLRMIRITYAFSRIALLKHCIDGANSDEWRFNREDIKGLQNVCFLSFGRLHYPATFLNSNPQLVSFFTNVI